MRSAGRAGVMWKALLHQAEGLRVGDDGLGRSMTRCWRSPFANGKYLGYHYRSTPAFISRKTMIDVVAVVADDIDDS